MPARRAWRISDAGFAHARKDHLAGIAACGQHAVEFTA
jgi:hypothetical protein